MSTQLRRPTRRKRRTEHESIRSILIKSALTLGAIVAFLAFAVKVQKGVPGRHYAKVFVSIPKSGSLRSNDKVAIGGVRVGRVVQVTTSDKNARVELQINPGTNLAKDTKAMIRANGLLGARYVQLIPGTDRARLASGSTIKSGASDLSSTVPDALDVFDKQTRGQLGTAVTGLGEGFMGHGDGLNDGVRLSSDAARPFAQIFDTVGEKGKPAELVPSLDSGVSALNASSPQLRRLWSPAATTLQAFADKKDAIQSTLTQAPSALSAGASGLTSGTRLLASVRQLSDSAHRTLPVAPEGLRQTTALLKEARDGGDGSPLSRATDLLGQVPPAVPKVLKATDALRPLLPQLDEAFGEATPIVKYIGRYKCDFVNTGITLRSMTGFVGTGKGPNGPSSQFRLQAAAGSEALGIKEGVANRDVYYQPCKYLGGTHKFVPNDKGQP